MERKRQILIIDDDPDMLELLKDILESTIPEIEVIAATNASEGYEVYRSQFPSLIISDFKMPQFSGFEFLLRIRKSDHHTPIILVTGYATEISSAISLDRSTIVISKPFKEETIREAVTNLLYCDETVERTKILLIDDSPNLHFVLGHLLETIGGYEIYHASDESSGLSEFRCRRDIGLVIADVRMPAVEAKAMFSKMRAVDPNVPILVISGNNTGELKRHLSTLAIEEWISRAFESTDMLETIKNLLVRSNII